MLAEKALKCKAAETHGLLRFVVMTLEKYKECFRGVKSRKCLIFFVGQGVQLKLSIRL